MLRVEFLESRETPSLFPTDPIGPTTPPSSGPVDTSPPSTTPPTSTGDTPPSNVPPTDPIGPINP